MPSFPARRWRDGLSERIRRVTRWVGWLWVWAIWGVLPVFASDRSDGLDVETGAISEGKTSAYFYLGQFSDTRFNQVVRGNTEFQSSWIAVAGFARELSTIGRHLTVEAEWQLGQHFGKQHHQELNALVVFRWDRFPWNEVLPTAVAYGNGFSYATRPPAVEQASRRDPARFLFYFYVELEASRPRLPDWSLFLRLHHRSGVFGVVSDAPGSNFAGLGLRYRF